jgi:O-antigen/teichoic acid export membrane protein
LEVEVNVAKGAASLYLASIVSLVLNTVYFVVLTNVLSASLVGLVSLLNVLVLAGVTAASLALPAVGALGSATPPAVSRFIAEYMKEGRSRAARRVFLTSILIAVAISVPIAAFLSLPSVSGSISFPLSSQPVVFAAIDIVILAVAQVGAYSMIGAGRATRAGSIIAGTALVKYTSASSLLVMGWGASGVFIGFSIGDFALAASSISLASRSIPVSGDSRFDGRAVTTYMVSILASSLIGYGVSQTDRLLAFLQRGFSDLALYNAASVGAAVASFAPAAVTNVLVPILSSLRGEDASQRREILRNYTRYVSLISFPMGFGLAAIAPSLLWLFGENYVSGSPLIAVIGISISLTAVSSVYSSSLLASRKTYNFLLGNGIALLSLVSISFILVPIAGLVGVALARAGMFVVAALAFALFARGMGEFVIDLRGYVKALVASTVMGGVIYAMLTWASATLIRTRLGAVALGVVLIPVGVVIYLLAMKLLRAFSERDMEFAEKLLPKSFSRLVQLARRFLL